MKSRITAPCRGSRELLQRKRVTLEKIWAVVLAYYLYTVVPALGDPVVNDHLPCTATLSLSQHISTLNYLGSADTCLTRARTVLYWLFVPAITDSANKCRVFSGHFNPKSLATRTLRPCLHCKSCCRNSTDMSDQPCMWTRYVGNKTWPYFGKLNLHERRITVPAQLVVSEQAQCERGLYLCRWEVALPIGHHKLCARKWQSIQHYIYL